MNLSHLYNKIVSTYRPKDEVDSVFSQKRPYYVNLSSLSCRVQKKKGFEPVEGGRKYSKISHVLYCAEDTDILLKDVILYNGITFSIVDIKKEGNDKCYLKVSLEKSNVILETSVTYDNYTLKQATGTFSGFSDYIEYDTNLLLSTSYLGTLLQWSGLYRDDVGGSQISNLISLQGPTSVDNAKLSQSKALLFNNEMYFSTFYKGRLLKFDGVDRLVLAADMPEVVPDTFKVTDILEYNSKIYGVSETGYLYSYSGSGNWVQETVTGKVTDIIVFNDEIYGINAHIQEETSTIGTLYKWDGSDWELVVSAPSTDCYFNIANYTTRQETSDYDESQINYYPNIATVSDRIYLIFTDNTPTSYLYYYDTSSSEWNLVDSISDRYFYGLSVINDALWIGASDGTQSYIFGLEEGSLKELVTKNDYSGYNETFTIGCSYNNKIFFILKDLADDIDGGSLYELVPE